MEIQLGTLGGLWLTCDGVHMDVLLGQRSRAALFVYLAVERHVSRESVTAVFWPESDAENARQSLRQSIYQLRRALGPASIESRAHKLRVGAQVRTDVGAYCTALERGTAEAAARRYMGSFLHGVNLLDLKQWESWVDAQRARHARDFRRVSREWVDARRAAGDLAGAIEAAQHWVAPDPYDDEPQHRLIEALSDAGERTEAIRQFEMYARLLEPDGLRPLDHTVELIERVRSYTTPWPTAVAPPAPATPPALASRPVPASSPPALIRDEPTPQPVASAAKPPVPHRRRPSVRRPTHVLSTVAVLTLLFGAFWLVDPRSVGNLPASLQEEGAVAQAERILLADFSGPTADPALGAVVTEALRIDLLQTPVLRLLDSSEIRESLQRMQVPDGTPLTADRAHELALRSGIKAVLEGDIAQAGTGYVLTAALRSTMTDRVLAAFRETADGPDEVIAAIDRLSQQVRRFAGESLRSIESAPQLAEVTTSSLDALRIYGEADRAFQRSDYRRVIPLLEETLALDPEFAMAWRLLAVVLTNTQWDRRRGVEAATRAYELRHRLSPRERYLAAASYYSNVTSDHDAAVAAYQRVLDLDPDDPVALNNLGLRYRHTGQFELAAELFTKAVNRPDPSPAAYYNLVRTHLARDRIADARAVANALSARYPDEPAAAEAGFWVLLRQGDEAAAAARFEAVLAEPGRSPGERGRAHDRLGRLALWRGRLNDARKHLETAELIMRDAGAPYNAFAWRISRAHAEAAVGDPERGVRLLLQGIDDGMLDGVAPPDRHHYHQAVIFALAGRHGDAEAVLRRLDADVPPELRSDVHTGSESIRALIELHRGNPAEAARKLDYIRATSTCRFCFAPWMGWALRDLSRLDDAAAEWEAVLTDGDSYEDVGFQLANQLWALQRLPALYEELSDTASAISHYRRLVELWQDADPELQPRVEYARQRLAALIGRHRLSAGRLPVRRVDDH